MQKARCLSLASFFWFGLMFACNACGAPYSAEVGRLLPHKQTLDQPKNLAYVMQNAGVFVPDKFLVWSNACSSKPT